MLAIIGPHEDALLVGGAAVEWHVGRTGCRPRLDDIDIGLKLSGDPFVGEAVPPSAATQKQALERFRSAGYPFANRIQELVTPLGWRAPRQGDPWVSVIKVIPASGASVEFLDESLLPPRAFDELAGWETLRAELPNGSTLSARFKVQLPLVVAAAKMRSGRIWTLTDPGADDVEKARQDLVDVAFLVASASMPSLTSQARLICQANSRATETVTVPVAADWRSMSTLLRRVANDEDLQADLTAHMAQRSGADQGQRALPDLGVVAQRLSGLARLATKFNDSLVARGPVIA